MTQEDQAQAVVNTEKDDARAQLQGILDAAVAEFNGPGAVDRLEQLKSAVATAQMALDHLYDEADRMPEANYRGGTQ